MLTLLPALPGYHPVPSLPVVTQHRGIRATVLRASVADAGVPTDDELVHALERASRASDEAIAARTTADDLAMMPYFKKTEQEAKQQRIQDAHEWAAKAAELEAAAEEARATAQLALARVNEHEIEMAGTAAAHDKKPPVFEAGGDAASSAEVGFNGGGENRGADIGGIVAITMPTVLIVLALPAIADWFNKGFS